MTYKPLIFSDREEAGALLAEELLPYKHYNPTVFAIPRGGVPVGFKVAESLGTVLDVVVTRRLSMPQNPQFGFGAIAPADVVTIDRSLQTALGISDSLLNEIISQKIVEMKRRMREYKSGTYAPQGSIDTVILVDDGLATGVTARAAIETLRILHNPRKIIFAAPVCAHDTALMLREVIDNVVCIHHPEHLFAIKNWYEDFDQIGDKDIQSYLEDAQEFSEKSYNNKDQSLVV